jgi:EAL domain-containing protein (putative c-di-GMP-specific phosphodiesterase class I)
VEAKLRDDLRFNRFRLYFQPICDENQNICRFEALLRSPNMHLAKIGPGQFIPIAEECGLIIPLGRWVIREVCRQMAEWRAQGMTLCPVAVNVSGRQLFRKEFVSEVLQDIKRHNIQPEMLELELTETTLMNRLGSAMETITELAQAGISFAIDDFGTGYSSLSRLNQLPIKALKIDASFVKQLEMESGSYTIVRAVMQMAKSLGLSVIAEGIESQEQFDILRGLGCDFFQGYLIAKPMPAEDAITRIEMNQMRHIQNQTTPHWSSHLVARNI